MASNPIAFTAVALGLVLTGAAIGTGVQGLSRKPAEPLPTESASPSPVVFQPSPRTTLYTAPLAAPTHQPSAAVVIYSPKNDGANLRNYPSYTQGAIEGVLVNGTAVTPGKRVGEFVAITTASGVTGWVHQTMLATSR